MLKRLGMGCEDKVMSELGYLGMQGICVGFRGIICIVMGFQGDIKQQ